MSDYFEMAKELLDKQPLPSRKHIKKVFASHAYKAANDYLYAKCMKPANYPVPCVNGALVRCFQVHSSEVYLFYTLKVFVIRREDAIIDLG